MRLSIFLTFTGLVSTTMAGYTIEDDYEPNSFFSMFNFFTSSDPTNGYVQYVSQTSAQSAGLINTNNGAVYMGVDYTSVPSGSGRNSVRITSKKSYTHGLVILDLAHMPGGICGTWPAFWMVGPSWPNNGEIDIIEGVNSQNSNAMTLHTDAGCSITNNGHYTGTMTTPNCYVSASGQSANAGCQITTPNTASYGTGFNADGGGVYATEWTSDGISIWFFPRGSIPSDISSGSPEPTGWGTPTSVFSGDCDIDSHFDNLQIVWNNTGALNEPQLTFFQVFDITFCGDWAGNVWATDPVCSSKAATCQAFVQNNPSAFQNAYWEVNSLKVFQSNAAASPAAAFATPAASDPIASAQATSLTHTRITTLVQTSPVLAAVGETSAGAVIVSAAAAEDPNAKVAPTEAATTGGMSAASSQTSPHLIVSLSSTITSTMTVNGDISAASLTPTAPVPGPLTVTSTIASAGSYVTVSALDAFEFPSSDELQTAGLRKRHLHRHMGRHQKKRHGII